MPPLFSQQPRRTRGSPFRNGSGSEFAKKYRITRLVHAEEYDNPTDANAREKQLKGWRRDRKNELVRSMNPEWRDLMPPT